MIVCLKKTQEPLLNDFLEKETKESTNFMTCKMLSDAYNAKKDNKNTPLASEETRCFSQKFFIGNDNRLLFQVMDYELEPNMWRNPSIRYE